jgi:hypothetical protein
MLTMNFANGVRPVPQEIMVKKFEEKLPTPRLAAMIKPTFQALLVIARADNRCAQLSAEHDDLHPARHHPWLPS